jgi:hypothetical protein
MCWVMTKSNNPVNSLLDRFETIDDRRKELARLDTSVFTYVSHKRADSYTRPKLLGVPSSNRLALRWCQENLPTLDEAIREVRDVFVEHLYNPEVQVFNRDSNPVHERAEVNLFYRMLTHEFKGLWKPASEIHPLLAQAEQLREDFEFLQRIAPDQIAALETLRRVIDVSVPLRETIIARTATLQRKLRFRYPLIDDILSHEEETQKQSYYYYSRSDYALPRQAMLNYLSYVESHT